MPGKYGFAYGNPELYDTTRGLDNTYTLKASNNYNDNPTSVTLYAIWAYEYQMTYDANDGSSAPSMEHEYTNQATHIYTLSENYPSRPGHKFLGWSDNSAGKDPANLNASDVDYYPDNDAFGNDKPKHKNVTADSSGRTKMKIYAVWEKL